MPRFDPDALLPAEMASKAEQVGVQKAALDGVTMFALAVLGGAFIALGAAFSTTLAAGSAAMPYGAGRLLTGLVFSLGLILVVVGGAELFTGNNLIVMAWAGGKVSTSRLLRNWAIVYSGNLAGALGMAILVFAGRQYEFGQGSVGVAALEIARNKTSLDFIQAVALGTLCNLLVCLAVWLCFSARTVADRILAIVPPIAAFVACGFEHSVANMYFIPLGLLIKEFGTRAFWENGAAMAERYQGITWGSFIWVNLVPVTLGNLAGGAVLVGLTYWFVYLRRSNAQHRTPR